MKFIYILVVVGSLLGLQACSLPFEANLNTSPESAFPAEEPADVPSLVLVDSASPFSLEAKFVQNHSYGPLDRNVLDIFLPKAAFDSKTPTPLVIYIHAGGFTSGSKENAWNSGSGQAMIANFISNGIAFATINYPYLVDPESEGVIKSLNSSKRALQYLRYHHSTFNINKNKVVLMGSSAGASTSLWLAMRSDMADSSNADPVLRESTRVLGAAATETQATLDLVAWETIFASYSFSLSSIASNAINFYGATQLSDLTSEPIVTYRNKVDILAHMDGTDPEIWVANNNIANVAPTTTSILNHHPYHAKALKDRAEAVGMTGKFYISGLSISDPSNESLTNFILRKLQ